MTGFDSHRYIQEQSDSIRERMSQFPGRLYMEVGGSFLTDNHAARVLPGYALDTKYQIYQSLVDDVAVIVCVSAQDVLADMRIGISQQSYVDAVDSMLVDIYQQLGIKPLISFTQVDPSTTDQRIHDLRDRYEQSGYRVCYKFLIPGYPDDVDYIISEQGFGHDEWLDFDGQLVLVTGVAPDSGKMATSLSQLYLDTQRNIDTGIAKFETFPIWNLGLDHPVNLAYEAATANFEDFNCIDFHHEEYYHHHVTNYNRDVEAYAQVQELVSRIVPSINIMHGYHSPTDINISRAGFAITDDRICAQAALQEIRSRRDQYADMVRRGVGKQVWVEDCDRLIAQAEKYFM